MVIEMDQKIKFYTEDSWKDHCENKKLAEKYFRDYKRLRSFQNRVNSILTACFYYFIMDSPLIDEQEKEFDEYIKRQSVKRFQWTIKELENIKLVILNKRILGDLYFKYLDIKMNPVGNKENKGLFKELALNLYLINKINDKLAYLVPKKVDCVLQNKNYTILITELLQNRHTIEKVGRMLINLENELEMDSNEVADKQELNFANDPNVKKRDKELDKDLKQSFKNNNIFKIKSMLTRGYLRRKYGYIEEENKFVENVEKFLVKNYSQEKRYRQLNRLRKSVLRLLTKNKSEAAKFHYIIFKIDNLLTSTPNNKEEDKSNTSKKFPKKWKIGLDLENKIKNLGYIIRNAVSKLKRKVTKPFTLTPFKRDTQNPGFHNRTNKATQRILIVITIIFILGTSMAYLNTYQANMQKNALLLMPFIPKHQDPITDNIMVLQHEGGGFALDGQNATIEATYQAINFLKLYGYFGSSGKNPKGFDRYGLIDWLMSRWALEGGFKETGNELPDIVNTAKGLSILRDVNADEQLHSLRAIAFEKILAMVGGKIILSRLVQEPLENQYWAIIAAKALDPTRGLGEIGLDTLSLDEIFTQSQKFAHSSDWSDDNEVKLIWGEKFYLDNDSVSVLTPYEENLDRYWYLTNIFNELFENPNERETLFNMLLDKDLLGEQIIEEVGLKEDGTFSSIKDAWYGLDALNLLGESDELYAYEKYLNLTDWIGDDPFEETVNTMAMATDYGLPSLMDMTNYLDLGYYQISLLKKIESYINSAHYDYKPNFETLDNGTVIISNYSCSETPVKDGLGFPREGEEIPEELFPFLDYILILSIKTKF